MDELDKLLVNRSCRSWLQNNLTGTTYTMSYTQEASLVLTVGHTAPSGGVKIGLL